MTSNAYTTVANSMVLNSQLLTARMSEPVGSAGRVLQITEPVGPSSNAGELSRQSLTLTAGTEAPVVGWIDWVGTVAEVRDYASTQKAFELRYRKPFDLTEVEYRHWVGRLMEHLRELGVRAAVVGDDLHGRETEPGGPVATNPTLAVARMQRPPSSLPMGVILALGGALLLLSTALYLATR